MIYLIVGITGILGATSRYYIGVYVDPTWNHPFPLNTFITNMIGCSIIGLMTAWAAQVKHIRPEFISAAISGFVGSLTTFSHFAVESADLINREDFGVMLLYTSASLFIGLALTWLSFAIGKYLWRSSDLRVETKDD